MAVAGGFLTSCEDDCVDCKCEMRIDAVIDSYNNQEMPTLRFDKTVIFKGEGLGGVTHVDLIDGDGNVDTTLYLRPTFVTNNAIIVKIEGRANTLNLSEFKFYSKQCKEPYAFEIECAGDPVVKGFFSEFVPNGKLLKIAGDFFYENDETPLEVTFENGDNERIKGSIESYTKSSINVIVPEGTKEGSKVWVKTPISETEAKVKLNDKSRVFLDFDNLKAGEGMYGSVKDGQWSDGATQTTELDKVPTGMGNFGAMTFPGGWDWNDWNTLSMDGSTRNLDDPTWGKKNLLSMSEEVPAYDYANNNYVLKFEVFVPEDKPINHGFIVAFSEWEAEDNCGDHYNGTDFYCWNYLQAGDETALPGAVMMFDRNTVTVDAEGQPSVSVGGEKTFSTNGEWMTVALPLTSKYFHVACAASGLFNTVAGRSSMGHLEAKDFYNMWIFPNPNGGAGETKDYFIAFDNFRIVEENGSGMLLGLFGQGTTDGAAAAKNDWFNMGGN